MILLASDPSITNVLELFRDIFSCPILFSLWRIRRTWLRNIVKKCSNIVVQREIFKRLGEVVYGIWRKGETMDALGKLMEDFVDQTAFMEYFKATWVPKLGRPNVFPCSECRLFYFKFVIVYMELILILI